jgi:aryl-alcohol dehydrogenase-like predicted oxidoreductase
MTSHDLIDRRTFGPHTDLVSIMGLGGYHLGQVKTVTEAVRIVQEAVDAGLNFLDNAWEYHEGESERRMGRAIKGRRASVFLMTKVCTHGRDARVAMRQLEESLRRLQTDHLDLWQIHECVYYNDPERHFSRGVSSKRWSSQRRRARSGTSVSPATRIPRYTCECWRTIFPSTPANCR